MRLEVGQTVVLLPDQLEAMAGTVKWTSGQSAGIQFSRPISPAAVDHFCQEHPIERRLKTVRLVTQDVAPSKDSPDPAP
jgi:hypothetical protein